MNANDIIVWAIPWFLVTMLLELALYRREGASEGRHGYAGKDSACSLAMGVGNVVLGAVFKFWSLGVVVWAYPYRLFDIPNAWWAWGLLIVFEDHCYYWFHRAHHEVRLLWAAHVNHHSSRHYNLSTALRQSWTTPLTGPIFWVPLALVGFSPAMIAVAQVVSLLYQYWIHTELIDRLGPLELLFNTPSHHRVHHGRNPQYLDTNYGGILIVWDRLYGTFEAEGEPVDFGLTTNLDTHNPLRVAFHEWVEVGRDAVRAPWRDKFAVVFRSPAWVASRRVPAEVPAAAPLGRAAP